MISDVAIDEDTWTRGGPLRQAEWKAIIRDMIGDPDLRFAHDGSRLRIVCRKGRTSFELWPSDTNAAPSAGAEPLAAGDVPAHEVKRYIEAYIDVVSQIEKTDQGYGSTRLEALDMAKRLTHDDGAKSLAPFLGATLGADHVTLRRLFTLLVALRVDTTTAAGLRGHRRVL